MVYESAHIYSFLETQKNLKHFLCMMNITIHVHYEREEKKSLR